MMKKTDAGWLLFVIAVFLIGGVCTGMGDEVAPAKSLPPTPAAVAPAEAAVTPTEAPPAITTLAAVPVVPAASESAGPVPGSPREKALVRMEAIKDLPLDELKKKLSETEANLPALNAKLGESERDVQAVREVAAASSQEIQNLYVQIRSLHDRIAALTEALPEVQAKLTEQTGIRSELLGEMDFRTRLTGLIRQKEAAAAASSKTEKLP